MWPYLRPDACGVGLYSAFGPLLIAQMRDAASSNRGALALVAGIMAISTLLPILVLPRRADQTNAIEVESHPLPKEVDVIASRVTTANPPHAQ